MAMTMAVPTVLVSTSVPAGARRREIHPGPGALDDPGRLVLGGRRPSLDTDHLRRLFAAVVDPAHEPRALDAPR